MRYICLEEIGVVIKNVGKQTKTEKVIKNLKAKEKNNIIEIFILN